jgi:hypothetical protein
MSAVLITELRISGERAAVNAARIVCGGSSLTSKTYAPGSHRAV